MILALGFQERELNASWAALPDLGIRVSDTDRPEPDVVVTPADQRLPDPWERETKNVIGAFEVLSPSTKGRDLGWKRTAYTGLPSLTHYSAIAQDAVDVVVFACDKDFVEQRMRSLKEEIELRSLGISVPLAEIYRDTGLTA